MFSLFSAVALAACGDGSPAKHDGSAGADAGMGAAGAGGAPAPDGGAAGKDTGEDTTTTDATVTPDATGSPDAADDAPVDTAIGSDASDVAPDLHVAVPATAVPTAALDFGAVACGSAGGSKTLMFSNTGDGTLHYRALVTAAGLFALQGAGADGSVSGDVAPGASATVTVLAGTVSTTSAAGAAFSGTLAVMTNAAGADDVRVPLTMTATGATCTLTCGTFMKCTPASGAPYCANTTTDNDNCGTCGRACSAGLVCSGGTCALTCGALTKCSPAAADPYCANTMTDNADCGACGNVCPSGQTCSGGACTLTCGALTKCSPAGGAPYCANTNTANADCGACGNVCASGQICTGGVCTLTCGALTKCSPAGGAAPYCANTTTDNANCGACGNACASGQMCTGGACALTCGALTKCSPAGGAAPYCANTTTDNVNCGTCGHACAAGQACVSGACSTTCGGTDTVCGGKCTNTSFDPTNCGTCGTTCGFANASASCLGGTCFMAACGAGFVDCDRDQTTGCEVNKTTDALNCGACGHACALGETCVASVCTANLTQGLIGYWSMDDAPGSAAATDASPNHLNGALQGSVSFSPAGGKKGTGAATFAGGGYIRVVFPNNALNEGSGIFIPKGNLTFAMWFKTTSPNVGGLQVIEGSPTHSGCDRVVGNGAGGTLKYNAWNEVNMSEAFVVNDGFWHQMVYVLDKTSGFKAYIDGVLEVSDGTPTGNCGVGCSGFDWATEYWIGRSAGCRFGADYFTGTIDDVRIYDHVLSPTAVVQLYDATK